MANGMVLLSESPGNAGSQQAERLKAETNNTKSLDADENDFGGLLMSVRRSTNSFFGLSEDES